MANLEGKDRKLAVLRVEDIEKLTYHEKIALGHIMERIGEQRAAGGKSR